MIGMKHVLLVALAVVMLSACTVTASDRRPVVKTYPRVVVGVDEHHHRHDDHYDDRRHGHDDDYGYRDDRRRRSCPPGHSKKGWCGRFR